MDDLPAVCRHADASPFRVAQVEIYGITFFGHSKPDRPHLALEHCARVESRNCIGERIGRRHRSCPDVVVETAEVKLELARADRPRLSASTADERGIRAEVGIAEQLDPSV